MTTVGGKAGYATPQEHVTRRVQMMTVVAAEGNSITSGTAKRRTCRGLWGNSWSQVDYKESKLI